MIFSILFMCYSFILLARIHYLVGVIKIGVMVVVFISTAGVPALCLFHLVADDERVECVCVWHTTPVMAHTFAG